MKKRDTERNHIYANEVFSFLNIYDIQGLLKEEDVFKCGVEAYQVADFNLIRFDTLNQKAEKARFKFCAHLGVPYYVIIASEASGYYQVYGTNLNQGFVDFKLIFNFSKPEFIDWWRTHQSFNQKKAMFNAKARIADSIIDRDLFSNALAWGVNIDGFTLDNQTDKVISIFEKRIRSYNPPFTVDNYDPNSFFHGTATRPGDFASWSILFELVKKMNVAFFLFTFDTSCDKKIGVSKIVGISKQIGISYKNNLSPNANLFIDDLPRMSDWLIDNAEN